MSSANTADVEIVGGRYHVRTHDVQDQTSSSDTTLYPGDPVKVSGNYVVHVATGEPTITAPFLGIAYSTSTETTTADGTVQVAEVIPGETVMRCKATTSTNMDTAAELLGLKHDCVTFDLTSTTYTIDEDEGTDPNVHGLEIVDGDITNGTLDFVARAYACEYHSST